MTQKKSKDKASEKQTFNMVDMARQIWLAGLGAFAKAEEEGGRVFEALVLEGEKVEAHTRKVAEDKMEEVKGKVEQVRGKATDTWDGLEQVFEDRVARVLNRLGVPTNDDVQDLAKRVEELNATVKSLNK
ncbi:MAG: phasin family protein [Candidatus Competibacteraceae bacterium]|jgi:poly(hydroxyalkanoate) granule-associated protein|nr:phasin family protein [Candidatus Competibacteraceae bacterium]